MQKRTMGVMAIACVAVAGCADKKQPAVTPSIAVAESTAPGEAAAAITVTAVVEKIDYKTRTVTLLGPDGERATTRVGDEVRNFDQVKKGDEVTVTYYESLALSLRDAKGEKPSIDVAEGVDRAPLGAKPGAAVVRDVTITAKVLGIDRRRSTVTLEGPEGNRVTLKVQDPRNLDKAEVGKLVQATYREAMAISVDKPTKK